MDRMGRLDGSAGIADGGFQESLTRLSLHLATRRPAQALPEPSPPPRRFRVAWPYVVLIAIVAAGGAGYPYYRWLVQDDDSRPATPAPGDTTSAATAAPKLVQAAIAVAPDPGPPSRPPEPSVEASSPKPKPIDVAAEIPAPPPPAPPVIVPAPTDTVAPQPESALSWADIVEIQKRLASLGIDPGPIDGVVGPRTIASVRKYEERVHHAVTGKVDRSLLSLLRQDPDRPSRLQARAP